MKTEAKTGSQNAATTCEVHMQRDQCVQKREAAVSEAKKHVAILRNDHILTFGQVFETSLTSLNSFNVCFAVLTLLTPCCTWLTIVKAHATLTNSNAHISVQKLLRCKSEAYTTNMYT